MPRQVVSGTVLGQRCVRRKEPNRGVDGAQANGPAAPLVAGPLRIPLAGRPGQRRIGSVKPAQMATDCQRSDVHWQPASY